MDKTVMPLCPRCGHKGVFHCRSKACTWLWCPTCSVPATKDRAPWRYIWDAFTGRISAPPAEARRSA